MSSIETKTFGIEIVPYKPEKIKESGIGPFTAYVNQQPVFQIVFFNDHYNVYGIREINHTVFLDIWELVLGSLGKEYENLDVIDYLITKPDGEVQGKTIKFTSRPDLEKIIGQHNDATYMKFISSIAELWGDIVDVIQQGPRVGVDLRQVFLPQQYGFIKHLTNHPLSEEQIDYIGQFLAQKAIEKYTSPN